ncbi:MAG: pseudouridine synthase family protein [Cyanobacteria bacterium RYN_339]|nr:pseudouridine synthase family protein [Cyanobacteria bacterium RYN_339]
MRYMLLHKPYGVLSQFTDEAGHPGLKALVPEPGIYPVGRLDHDSEGLLLLTDDGGLAHRLADPKYEHPKTYWAQVERVPDEEALGTLRGGVMIQGRRTLPADARLLDLEIPPRDPPIRYRANIPTAWIELVLREGRNRQVRKMTAAVGFPTLRLMRVAIGPLQLGELAPGERRELTTDEVTALRELKRSPRAPSGD